MVSEKPQRMNSVTSDWFLMALDCSAQTLSFSIAAPKKVCGIYGLYR